MKKLILLALLLPVAAIAGKEEREYMKTTVTPAIIEAQNAFTKACGCNWKISVDEKTIASTDDMYKVKHTAETIKDGAAGYCTDAESKKAVCKVKTITISKAQASTFTFKDSNGVVTTDGYSSISFENMTAELDK